MSEGDVVPFGPPCKHLLLCDKAVVVASSTALVLYVCDTFIRSPGLVVVVGHLLGSRLLPERTSIVGCLYKSTPPICSSETLTLTRSSQAEPSHRP